MMLSGQKVMYLRRRKFVFCLMGLGTSAVLTHSITQVQEAGVIKYLIPSTNMK
jgi:hypothetical protein